MDERDLPKAPLSLFHIVETSGNGDGGYTGRRLAGTTSRKRLNGDVGNSKSTTQTKFNHGSIHVIYATVPDATVTWETRKPLFWLIVKGALRVAAHLTPTTTNCSLPEPKRAH